MLTIQDSFLTVAQLKALLNLAGGGGLGCAVGLSPDKREVVVLVDRKATGKKLAEQLTDKNSKLEPASVRFGQLSIDTTNDPDTVKFEMNKSVPGGTIPLLVKLIRKTGYSGVSVGIKAAEEVGPMAVASSEIPPAPPPPPKPPAADALKLRLAGLVKRVAQAGTADPAGKDSLVALAREAGAALAFGGPAAEKIDALEAAITASMAGSPGGVAEGPKATDDPTVAMAKSSLLWRGTRNQMRGKLDTLKRAILDAYADEQEVQTVIRGKMGELDKIFVKLDDRLDTALNKAVESTNGDDRRKYLEQAREIIGEYSDIVANDRLISQLDTNPFGVELGFRSTLDKVLTVVAAHTRTLN